MDVGMIDCRYRAVLITTKNLKPVAPVCMSSVTFRPRWVRLSAKIYPACNDTLTTEPLGRATSQNWFNQNLSCMQRHINNGTIGPCNKPKLSAVWLSLADDKLCLSFPGFNPITPLAFLMSLLSLFLFSLDSHYNN